MFSTIDIVVGVIGASAGLISLITGIVAYRRYKRELANGVRDPHARSRP